MQDQPLRKRNRSEGSDPSPCKEPVSRSPCAPPWLATQLIAAACSPSHSWGVSFPQSLGSAQSPARGSGNGQSSLWVGEMQPSPQQLGHPFFSNLPGHTSLMATYPQRDKAPCTWQPAPQPAERVPQHRFPCLEGPSPTRLGHLAPVSLLSAWQKLLTSCTVWLSLNAPRSWHHQVLR